jgi:hypothetical protein
MADSIAGGGRGPRGGLQQHGGNAVLDSGVLGSGFGGSGLCGSGNRN